MDSIRFTCIYCGAVVVNVFLSAALGVMAMRVWEAEDDEDYAFRKISATRIAWIISCMISGGFVAYIMSTAR